MENIYCRVFRLTSSSTNANLNTTDNATSAETDYLLKCTRNCREMLVFQLEKLELLEEMFLKQEE